MRKSDKVWSGFLALGHLVSYVGLLPDPHLTLWHSTLNGRDSIDAETDMDTDTDMESSELHSIVPPALSIICFAPIDVFAAPLCMSRHDIVSSDVQPINDKATYRRQRKQLGKETKTVKADACRSEPEEASFLVMLRESLQRYGTCAIVRLRGDHYGYIAVAHDEASSSLVLNVLDRQYSRACLPWLRATVDRIVSGAVADDFTRNKHETRQPEEDTLTTPMHPTSYTCAVQGDIPPLLDKDTLRTLFHKVQKLLKHLPQGAQTFYSECERIRKQAKAYMNDGIIHALIDFLMIQVNPTNDHSGLRPQAAAVVEELLQRLRQDNNQPLTLSEVA